MIQSLIDFLNSSPVNFLAVKNIAERLEEEGFQRYDATEQISDLQPGDQFYVTKTDSSIFAL